MRLMWLAERPHDLKLTVPDGMTPTPRDQTMKRMFEAMAARKNEGAEQDSGGAKRHAGSGAVVGNELADGALGASLDGSGGGVEGVRGDG